MGNVEYDAFSFQPGLYRRLLAENEVRLAPPPGAASNCLDRNSGAAISCASPHAMVMVLAGMACMVFLVCVALVLLCWSVWRQRRFRLRRQQQLANPQPSPPPPPLLQISPATAAAPADSEQYNDAVLVQLPGDDKPQFFALPKPFLVDGEKNLDKSKILDSDVDEKAPKEDDRRQEEEDQQQHRHRESVGVD